MKTTDISGACRVRRAVLTGIVACFAVTGYSAPFRVEMDLNGNVKLGTKGVRLALTVHQAGWTGTSHPARRDFTFPDPDAGSVAFELFADDVKTGHGTAVFRPLADGRAFYCVNATSDLDQNPEAVVLSLTFPCRWFENGTWTGADGKKRTFPQQRGDPFLYGGTTRALTFASADGAETFTIAFPVPTRVMIQDDRLWCPTFTLRVYPDASGAFDKGDQRAFACSLSAPDGVDARVARPVAIRRGPDWIPLDYRKNIEAGSAVDFSGMGLQDAPAGKYGWLRNAGGHFEFEKRPGVPQRFYGVNLCFEANFPDRALADELVTRLVRLGYNSVRIHHYESARGAIKGSKDRLTINREWMKRLDYLLYRAMEKGLYVTTDLFTTRPVHWRDIGIDRNGAVPMQVYKNMIAVHGPAFENWKTFSRNFLTHVNPYTGRRYADEPGLPMISLINEGNLAWCWHKIRREPAMKAAWKKWLTEKRAADPSFAKDVPEDAEKVERLDSAAFVRFTADLEDDLVRRQRAFLATLGVKALLTSQNCGRHYPAMMAVREKRYDYVDDHFYVDHPRFLVRPWTLPSRCPNANPVLSRHLPPVACAYTRMPSKPFCVTEWNFSGPGMFRGVGGIMTGAMGALQNWDGLWRFAYSHGSADLRDRTGFPGFFDTCTDPLGQASDRASICLFLRGDMAPLAEKLALTVTPASFGKPDGKAPGIVPAWLDAAWQTQVGTAVAPPPPGVKTFDLAGNVSKEKAPVPLAPNPRFTFDRAVGSFRIDTPRTAGGFTPKGTLSAGPVAFDVGNVPATVWASSLDGKPIADSARLLVTHLTDVQADGNVYADTAKTTLLKWGTYPPLVRNGAAVIRLALAAPRAYEVWALETTGRRVARLPVSVEDGRLVFTAAVKGPEGARMLYEVVRNDPWAETLPAARFKSGAAVPPVEVTAPRSVFVEGDFARFEKVWSRLDRGEPIRIAVIGGSITQGAGASEKANRWGERFCAGWRRAFPRAKIDFVNAGIGATGSAIGAFRLQRDVLSRKPDVVAVEFSVNDANTAESGAAYEGVMRQLLKAPGDIAVILLGMVNETGDSAHEWHGKVARHYNLPFVSWRDALYRPYVQDGTFKWSDLSPDTVHPNDIGHAYAAALLNHRLGRKYAEWKASGRPPAPVAPLPAPLFGTSYDKGSFCLMKDAKIRENKGFFPLRDSCWGEGLACTNAGDRLVFEVEGATVALLYRLGRAPFNWGKINVTIDGRRVAEGLDCFRDQWWWYTPSLFLCRNTPGRHVVEIEALADKNAGSAGYGCHLTGLLVSE